MVDNRKNLKVSEETYNKLKSDKPEGVTWDHYLQNHVSKTKLEDLIKEWQWQADTESVPDHFEQLYECINDLEDTIE